MKIAKEILMFYIDLIKRLWRKIKWPRRDQDPTNLNLTEWSKERLISLGISCAIYLVLLAATLYSSIDFWGSHAKTREVGVGFALLLDGLAMLCLVFRITRIQFPLNFLRHTLPLTTVIPVYLFAMQELGDIYLSVFVTGLILVFSWILQRHIENLFITPADLADEAVRAHARGLINEQVRRQAVDGVLLGFREESKVIADTSPTLSLPSATGREQFRIKYGVKHKDLTAAYQAYKAGKDFSQWVNK